MVLKAMLTQIILRIQELMLLSPFEKSSSSWKKAEEAGLHVSTVTDAVDGADLVMILAPDEFQQGVYESEIRPNLKANAVLAFAHGFNIHFEKIVPSEDMSVIMIAPKGPGHTVRSTYVNGGGVPSLIAIYQDGNNGLQVIQRKTLLCHMPKQMVALEQAF